MFEYNADQFGKRARMNVTRSGVIEELFFVCYYCAADDLTESEVQSHECETGD